MSNNTTPDSLKYPYSYHIFIFPFLWNDSGRVSRAQFAKCLHPSWKKDHRKNTPFDSSLYGQYVYFNQPARNVIFMEEDEKKPIVSNYRFDVANLGKHPNWLDKEKGFDNPVQYVIRKGNFTAHLRVNGIRLKLFNTGVGMIVFELENYEYDDEKSVNMINEYGRRVFMPYVEPDNKCSICADSIYLHTPERKVGGLVSGVELKSNDDVKLISPILFLLGNDRFKVSTAIKHARNEYYIEPIIDDRMFVCCLWCNNAFALQMSQYTDNGYRYLDDALSKAPTDSENTARMLYEFLFVDGQPISCRSRTMLHDMLKEHIYHRWLEYSEEYSTITGISEYSMVMATSDPISRNAFLFEYIEMVILVLAQRASLLAFERRISDCTRGKGKVDQIQKDYVLFQSRLLLREVTPQQQGIELYDMLLKNLFIDKECKDVESQISALFTLQNETHNQWDNLLLFGLALIAVTDAVGFFFAWVKPLVHESMCVDACEALCKFISNGACEAVIAFALIAVLIVFYVIGHLKRLK